VNTRIAIIGAGPGGLMCARVLQRHGIDVTVYDADTSVVARDPGGTLDLHADSGQIALEDAGLLNEFIALARFEGQAKTRLDQHGTVLSSFVPDEGDDGAPEIDRGQLRAMLAEHVTPNTVRWGHKLVAATSLADGVHRLEFANGFTAETDLVIGADGAWSRVRPLVSDAIPNYSGISFLEVRFDDVDSRHPAVAKLVGDGHMFATDGHRGIIGQRNSNGHVRGFVCMRTDLDWHTGIDLDDTPAIRQLLLREFQDWAAELLCFITDNDGGYAGRPIFALPAPLTWPHTSGVTLLGDAAHLMSPFGGFGVNFAMLDAAELAHALASEATVDAAITRYESTMFPRSGEHAVGANEALDRFFTPGTTTGPNPEEEHRRYKEAAATYRRTHARPTDGTWTLNFQTPRGQQHAELTLNTAGTTLTGTFNGQAIKDGHLDGSTITFQTRLTTPFPMTIKCTASTDGDTMTGTAKASMMSISFAGTRQ
jgi:2-polyprenyl-6-methoxyphenol hydroxylase-like FAD-dependent oxidoreductase